MALIPVGIISQFAYLSVAVRRFYFAADIRRLQPALFAAGAALLILCTELCFITGVQIFGGLLALWTA